MTATAEAPPQLRFRLIGQWHPVLLNQLDTADLIADFVASVVGSRDIDATVRARMRRDLNTGIATATSGHAQAMFIATEITPGLPMPVTLTIYTPPALRMSPAVGTRPDTVMSVLEQSLAHMDHPHLDTAARLAVDGSEVLRLHHVDPHELPEQPELRTPTLTADYWYTVPRSKRLVVATFSTPMADIPNLMLSYFDALVAASYWEDGERSRSSEVASEGAS